MSTQDRFFAAVSARRLVRPAVRAIVRSERGFLVQRPVDTPDGHYAFIGGEYELATRSRSGCGGNSRKKRRRRWWRRPTVSWSKIASSGGELIQTLEHYFEVELDRTEIASNEPDLEQMWLAPDRFAAADVRPLVVRDALASGDWLNVRRLAVPEAA